MEISKTCVILLVLSAIICFLGFLLLFFRGKYHTKLLVKLGLKESKPNVNWTLLSWKSSLEKLDYKADIAFFGDSLTRGGDFQNRFNEFKIVNLGLSGDTITGMNGRIEMLKSVSPKKVFIMGGINGMTSANMKQSIAQYGSMLKSIKEAVPNVELIVQSVLPISKQKEDAFRDNRCIINFNQQLKNLSQESGAAYIDLHSLFYKDGELLPELTVDGIHINSNGYDIWFENIEEYVYKRTDAVQ